VTRRRVRLDLAYDGTEFAGWARQPQQRTVQQTVEDALATILRLPAAPPLTVAGRTDAGVHASGQVAHVDLDLADDLEVLRRRLNRLLPDDVIVQRAEVVPAEFDARFAAIERHYVYRVADGVIDPLRRRDTLSWSKPLDVSAMDRAARELLGEHDFAAYCKPREGATTVRTLRELSVGRDLDAVVVIRAAADAFCHNQVRSMVGALLAVGEGRRTVRWPGEVLEAGVRDSAVTVAPAYGLTLVAVDYPPDDELGARTVMARRRRERATVRTTDE
jgi:tRNA pseudouridine38-40 synthase